MESMATRWFPVWLASSTIAWSVLKKIFFTVFLSIYQLVSSHFYCAENGMILFVFELKFVQMVYIEDSENRTILLEYA